MTELLSIREAAAKGIERLRMPVWAHPCAHLKIDIIRGEPGPWTHLYGPFNLECNGRDPVDVLCISMDYDAKDYVPHTGPTSDSDEYRKARDAYAGVMPSKPSADAPAQAAGSTQTGERGGV